MIPKRRRRSITVGARRYFWYHTDGRKNDHKFPQLVILPSSGGQLLIVNQTTWPTVTPAFLRIAIEDALKAGWDEGDRANLYCGESTLQANRSNNHLPSKCHVTTTLTGHYQAISLLKCGLQQFYAHEQSRTSLRGNLDRSALP